MGKLLAIATSGLFAIVMVLAMGQPAWAQNEVNFCEGAQNPQACDTCFANAGFDKQAMCECQCKWLTPKEMSRKECLAELCGTETGGIGSKIELGSVFGSEVYQTPSDAVFAAFNFVEAHQLTDSVTVVLKDFYKITQNADSWLIHLVGLPFTPPVCGAEGTCVAMMSRLDCSTPKNQDMNPFMAGCQPGRGCYETPPSEWLSGTACPTTMGCCNDPNGCLRVSTVGTSTVGDARPGNGFWGVSYAGCPTPP